MGISVAEAISTKKRWATAQAVGLLIAACGPAVLVVGGALAGLPVDDLIQFAVTAVILGLSGIAVARWARVGRVIGFFVGLAALFTMIWTIVGIAYPDSFFDFFPAIAGPGGVLFSLIAGVAGLVSRQRSPERPGGGAELIVVRSVVALVVLTAAASAILTLVSRTSVEASALAARTPVIQRRIAFDRPVYHVKSGRVKLVVRNNDPFLHTFTIPKLGVDQRITPGSADTVTFDAPPGTFVIYCKPHADVEDPDPPPGQMTAHLIVSE